MDILLRQMDLWYQGTPGNLLIKTEMTELAKILPEYSGRHLLQLGGPSGFALFQNSPTWHRLRLSPEYSSVFSGPSVQASFYRLPFFPESIDVILLPHVLEFVSKPELLLKEVYTVLAPEGYVILLGFNPMSLWGLNKWLRRHQHLPWRGRFWSLMHIKRWLTQQDFKIVEARSILFRPPIRNKETLDKLLFLEVMGRLCWSSMGGVNIIVAKKKQYGVTPLKEHLHPAPLA